MTNIISNKHIPNIVYYNDDHSNTPECTDELSHVIGATYSFPSTWAELTNEIENGEYKIVFHIDMITKHGVSIKEFINSLQLIIKFMPNHKPLRIMVLIKPDTSKYKIQELKDAGVFGIGLDTNYFPIDDVIACAKNHVTGENGWPNNIIDALPYTRKKPIHIYIRSGYEDVTAVDSTVVTQYDEILPVRVEICDSWEDLSRLLKLNPHQIALHPNTLMSAPDHPHTVSLTEIIVLIKTHLKLEKKDIPIALVVEKNTPLYIIKEAQAMGLQGLIPYHMHWPAEDTMAGLDALTNRVTHWPEHIINQLPAIEKKPINVFFRKDCEAYFKTIGGPEAVKKLSTDAPWQVLMCNSWEELGKAMEASPHQICLHIDMVTKYGATMNECVSMIETLLRVSNLKNVPIGLGIDKDTPLALIKQAQKCGVHGIVPAAKDFGLDAAYNGLDALYNRIPYWPKHILEQLPGFVKKPTKAGSIVLTHRQDQICQLIKERGASNKVIARLLGISESTVKLHITEIFKKYGVRSRTQLAVFSEKV